MLRAKMKGGKSNKPVMVMLHGSGSSGDILGIQTHFLAKELSRSFDLVFLDAPNPSNPGPGVLPLFEDMPGYYRWLTTSGQGDSVPTRLAEIFKLAAYIQTQLDAQKIDSTKVEAMFGFSQGALVAMTMLGLRLIGQSPWPNLRFCVSVGAGATGDEAQMAGIEQTVGVLSKLAHRDDGKFPGYVVNALGTEDLWYADGRRLADLCDEERSVTMDFKDGHVVPRKKDHVSRLLRSIESIDKKSKLDSGDETKNVNAVVEKESLPSLFPGEDSTRALAVLVESGLKV